MVGWPWTENYWRLLCEGECALRFLDVLTRLQWMNLHRTMSRIKILTVFDLAWMLYYIISDGGV